MRNERKSFDLQSPAEFLTGLWRRVRREWIVCFASSVLVGLLTHFYKFVNWLPNWDSLVFRHDPQNMTSLGRWFLRFACIPTTSYDLPWVGGVVSLVYIALAGVGVCALFKVRSRLVAALVGAFLAAAPTVTSTMTYNYVADGYELAFLFSVLSTLLFNAGGVCRILLGVILLACSLGVYQPYVGVTMTLMIVLLVDGLLFRQEGAKASLARAGRFLAGGVGACLVYLLCMKLALALGRTGLSEYIWDEGSGVGVSLDWHYAANVVRKSLRCIRDFFFDVRFGMNTYVFVNGVFFAALVALTLGAVVRSRVFRSPARLLLLLAYCASAPVCACPMYLVRPDARYHTLMTMGFVSALVYFALFYERRVFGSLRLENAKRWFVVLWGGLMVYCYALIANVSYHKLQMAFWGSYGEVVRMAAGIEQTPGANDCRTLAVLGVKPDSRHWSAFVGFEMTGVTDGSLLRPDDYMVNQSVITATLNDYCQKDFRFATVEERRALAADPRVRKMPFWPAFGSIAVVGDCVVLRLGEGAGLYDEPQGHH